MASRSSPLSLKARAIALLAQREHGVAELRRKLLRLAQQRDLQAWASTQGAPQSGTGPAGANMPPGVSSSPRVIGSFDLAEDWGDGELDAFMEGWDAETAPPEHGATLPTDLLGTEAAGIRREAVEEDPAGVDVLRCGSAAGAGRDRQGHLDLPARAERGPRRTGERAARRASPPSPEALQAVMDEGRQQARADEVEQLLQWLQERSYLSEVRLVESRINARASRYGNLRIQQELRQLGVAPDEEQQARLKDSEFERAREVWLRKFGGQVPVDAASRARQMRFLATRGFSSDVVRQLLRGEDD